MPFSKKFPEFLFLNGLLGGFFGKIKLKGLIPNQKFHRG